MAAQDGKEASVIYKLHPTVLAVSEVRSFPSSLLGPNKVGKGNDRARRGTWGVMMGLMNGVKNIREEEHEG